MGKSTCASVVVAMVVAAGPALADEATIEPVRDTAIFSNENASGQGNLFAGRTGNFSGGLFQRTLLEFDVASVVPPGATITSVEMTLTLIQAGPFGGDQTYGLHELHADWGEGKSAANDGTGAPATAGDATWTHTFFDTADWATPGGDFDPVASSSLLVTTVPGTYTWPSTPAVVADAQAWLDDPGSNNGWLLTIVNDAIIGTARRFEGREAAKASDRPKLHIVWESGTKDCAADLDGNGDVGFTDLVELLSDWGPCVDCQADLDGNGDVGFTDLVELLADWGPCP